MWVHSPLTSRVAQRIRGRRSLDDICLRKVELSPGVRVAPPPKAIYDERDLDRITAADDLGTLEAHFAFLAGTTEFGPSYAYQLPPVWFVDGNFSRGRFRFELNTERERLLVRSGDLPRVRGAAFVSSPYGNKFFGHHVTDDLPTALAGAQFGDPYYVNPPGPLGHVAEYRTACGIDHPTVWSGLAHESWVFHDPFINDSKLARLRELGDRFRATVPVPVDGPRRVYVRRGTSGMPRAPRNEGELESELVEEGWTVIDPTAISAAEIRRAVAHAEIVAGVEGSNLAHLLFSMQPGRGVVLVNPPHRFNLTIKDFFDRLGIRLGFHVGLQDDGGWNVDLAGFHRVVERIDGVLEV